MLDGTSATGAAPVAAAAPCGGPLFSYDVPQEVTYSGQSFIDLQVPLSYFSAQTTASPGGAS